MLGFWRELTPDGVGYIPHLHLGHVHQNSCSLEFWNDIPYHVVDKKIRTKTNKPLVWLFLRVVLDWKSSFNRSSAKNMRIYLLMRPIKTVTPSPCFHGRHSLYCAFDGNSSIYHTTMYINTHLQ